jgi:hypothetical protein
MQVSMRTGRIRLGGFERAPVVVHSDLSRDFFQAHPAGVPAIFVKGAADCPRHVTNLCEVAEVLDFIVVKIDRRDHAR